MQTSSVEPFEIKGLKTQQHFWVGHQVILKFFHVGYFDIFFIRYSTHINDTCDLPGKKKNPPKPKHHSRSGTLKYITLTGSAISIVFATSPKHIFKKFL